MIRKINMQGTKIFGVYQNQEKKNQSEMVSSPYSRSNYTYLPRSAIPTCSDKTGSQ